MTAGRSLGVFGGSFLDRLSPWGIVGVALSVRLVWLLVCPNEPVSDQIVYDMTARAIAAGQGYVGADGLPANYWPAGYPAILGAAYAVFGARFLVGYVLNALFWGGSTFFAFRIVSHLYGVRAGKACALVFALYPSFVLQTTLLASETPFIFGSLVAFDFFVRRFGEGGAGANWKSAFVFGLALGVLVYVQPPAFLLLAVPPLLLLIRRESVRRVVALSAVVVLGTFLALAPWGLRNRAHFGSFDLISKNGGPNLWMGNHVGTNGSYAELPKDVEGLPLGERDRVLRSRAVAFIRDNPLDYLGLCVKRAVVSLRSDTSSVGWNAVGIERSFGPKGTTLLRLVCTFAHYLLLLATLVAALRGRRNWTLEKEGILWVTILLLAVPFVFVVGGNRYAIPIIPFLIVLSSGLLRTSPAEAA